MERLSSTVRDGCGGVWLTTGRQAFERSGILFDRARCIEGDKDER